MYTSIAQYPPMKCASVLMFGFCLCTSTSPCLHCIYISIHYRAPYMQPYMHLLCRCAFFTFAFRTSCNRCTSSEDHLEHQRHACGQQKCRTSRKRYTVSVKCNACWCYSRVNILAVCSQDHPSSDNMFASALSTAHIYLQPS